MSEVQSVQWFPGHMAKTRRKITEDLKLVDIAAELLDARIPKSSANPVLRQIVRQKPRVVLLNKSDMADPAQTARWVDWYKAQGLLAVPIESKTGKGIPAFYSAVREALRTGSLHLWYNDQQISQLSNRKYSVNSSGRIELERKEAMKKRGLSSPDMADALALALHDPVVSDWSLEF